MSASGPSTDRNLLVGILALQLDFVSRDALIAAMHVWVLDKARPLGDILRDRGDLSPERLPMLSALVREHLKQHGDDPQRSLAALPALDPLVRQELQSIADADVQATLRQVSAARPGALSTTAPPAVPLATTAAVGPAAVARYRILRPHAKGGLGEVFVAEDTELGRHVALKEIQARYADDPGGRKRFVLEAEVTGRLEHPGVVPVYGLCTYADGRPFYAMRFIQGDNLRDAIRRFHDSDVADGGRRFEALAFRELLGRFVAVCQAVAYAHSRGILHRDLKPANVMLGKYGETLVVDWGLAKPVGRADATAAGEATLLPRSGAGSSGTVAGQVLGTAAYMAPEQAAGRLDELGPAADIYSLGATLYELLTGRVAFEAAYLDLILEDVRAGRFPPPRRVQPDVPPALNAICLKAMALKPADRYTTAQELAADIEHWLADEPVTAYREPLSARAWRWVRRHRTPVTGAAALLLTAAVGLAIGVVLVSQERDAKEQARKDAVTARDAEAAARQRTRQALNTLTDDVVERLLAKQVQLGDDERRFLRKVQGFYEEFAAAGGDTPEARAGRADGFLRIGFVRHRLGELAEAEAAYRDAGAVLARLVADYPAAPDYRIALGKNHNGLAVLLHDTGRTQQAEAAYNDALAVLAQLAADFPAAPEYRAGWSDIRFNLGNLLRETGRAQEAETAYRDALAHQGKLVAEFPGVPAYRANLAATHVNLGGLLGATDRPQERETAYRDAVTVYAALVAEFPDVPRYRTNLASSHNHLGHLLQVTGRPQETEAAYREALSILEKLTADFPTVAVYRADLASTLNHLGHLLRETNRPEEAETVQRHALTLCTKLAADSPTVPEYAHELAITLGGLVSLPQYSANHAQLRRWLEQALPYHRAVFQANPRDPKHRRAIWTNLRTLAITLANLGDYTTAIQRAEELAGLAIDPGEDTYFAGCFLAVGIRHATNDPALDETRRRELTESYARRSVERLRQGFVNGFTNHADLLKNHDFDPLRQRPDFIDLLWDLADTPAAK